MRNTVGRRIAAAVAIATAAVGFAIPAAAAPGDVHADSWYADGSRYCAAGQHMWVGFRAAGKITVEWTPTDWYDPHVRSYVAQDNPFMMIKRVDTDVQGGLWRVRAQQGTQPSDLTGIDWANADCA